MAEQHDALSEVRCVIEDQLAKGDKVGDGRRRRIPLSRPAPSRPIATEVLSFEVCLDAEGRIEMQIVDYLRL